MGFRFRRSVRLIPGVRLNLSKSGASVSLGGRGFHYTVGPKGTRTTVSLPGTGLSWTDYKPHAKPSVPALDTARASRSLAAQSAKELFLPIESPAPDRVGALSTSELAPILSRAAHGIPIAPFITGVGGLMLIASREQLVFAIVLIGTSILTCAAIRLDRYRRSVAIDYEPSGIAADAAEALRRAFSYLSDADRAWSVDATAQTSDWKRNAGATSINKRSATRLTTDRPRSIRGNASFPAINFGTQRLYFLPDAALFIEGKSVAALHYRDLRITHQTVQYIESERLPADANVVGSTWQYVNKSGGPDRRFKFNKQLPICLYSEMDFSSDGGLHGRLHLSAMNAGEVFARIAATLAQFLDTNAELKPVRAYRLPQLWPTLSFVAITLGFLACVGLLAARNFAEPSARVQTSVEIPPATNPPRSLTPAGPISISNAPLPIAMAPHAPMVIIPPSVMEPTDQKRPVPIPHLRPPQSNKP